MDKINKIKFRMGFWHPFGDHSDEDKDHIILRKQKEIRNNNGWTLWSFQNRKNETIEKWLKEIKKNERKIFVLCSDSKGTKDPSGKRFYAKQYKFANSDKWVDMPSAIEVLHPFGKKRMAMAFKVKSVYKPGTIRVPKRVKWLCMDGKWREDNLPTRGEYLIKSGGKCKLRKVYQILELGPPYLAVIRK